MIWRKRIHIGLAAAAAMLLGSCCSSTHKPTTPPTSKPAGASGGKRIGALSLDGIPDLPPDALQARVAQYLNVRDCRFADWDTRGDGMLILTRFGDTVQVHRLSQPLGARRQMSFFSEPVARASWIPGSYDGAVLVRMDQGGAENHQLYRLDLLAGKTTQLTTGKARVLSFRWANKSRKLAFASNARNGRDFDIYLADAKQPNSGKRVFASQGLFVPLDFSPDDKLLLLLRYVSLNESYLYALDLASGKAKPLAGAPPAPPPAPPAAGKGGKKKAASKKDADKGAPKKGDKKGDKKKASPKPGVPKKATVSYRAALWTADGKGLFVASDRDGEHVKLYRYDLAKDAFKPLSAKIDWSVEEIALSVDGRTLAFTVNEEGYSRLHLLDTRRKRTKAVKLPDGIVSGLRFSRQRKHASWLGFTLRRPTAPADVYSYDVKKRRKALVRWTKSEVGGLNPDFFIPPKLVRFPTFDQVDGKPRTIPAFYYKPPGDGPHPLVIHIHGGPEAQYRPRFSSLFQYWLMEMGVAVLAPNVRGSDGYGKSYLLLDNGAKREDSVKDIGALLDWIKARKELDATRVAVHGGSYGGYMVLASLVHYPGRIKAGIDWVGISNFVTFLENTRPYRRDLRRAEYGDERDPEMRALLTKISPMSKLSAIKAPLFVIQGANDPRVPRSESEQVVKALREAGNSVWYLLAHDEGHGFRKKKNRDFARLITIMFLRKVGLGKAK